MVNGHGQWARGNGQWVGLGRVKNGQMQSSIFVVGFYFDCCNSSRSSKRGFSGDNGCDGC